jgi:2-dehydro-3-deoxyphosphogluconate aldolase / (4S)-4-hydroxy-2-oxoglutarate aldolase
MRFNKTIFLEKFAQVPIMPLFNHPDVEVSKAVVQACYVGGVRVFEYTNRGENAPQVFAELVKYARQQMPDLVIGIGTVYDAEQAQMFVEMDTDFIVQPILNIEVGKVCQQHNMAWLPGVMTLTEIYQAQQAGSEIAKIFPANVLGTAFIKAIKGPMPQAKVMVTGGVEPNEANIRSWFEAGVFGVGMGSQLFPKEVLANKNYEWISQTVEQCIKVAQACR